MSMGYEYMTKLLNFFFCRFIYRYDLLCLEGLAQALRIFEELQDIPTYTLADISHQSMLKMHVKSEVLGWKVLCLLKCST